MAKANPKDLLLQSIHLLQQKKKLTDPRIIRMGVATAAGEDEAVVDSDVAVVGKVAGGDSVRIPNLPFFAQHFPENPKIPSVFLLHVLRIFCTQQHRKPLSHHFFRRRSFLSLDFLERERDFFLLVGFNRGIFCACFFWGGMEKAVRLYKDFVLPKRVYFLPLLLFCHPYIINIYQVRRI